MRYVHLPQLHCYLSPMELFENLQIRKLILSKSVMLSSKKEL